MTITAPWPGSGCVPAAPFSPPCLSTNRRRRAPTLPPGAFKLQQNASVNHNTHTTCISARSEEVKISTFSVISLVIRARRQRNARRASPTPPTSARFGKYTYRQTSSQSLYRLLGHGPCDGGRRVGAAGGASATTTSSTSPALSSGSTIAASSPLRGHRGPTTARSPCAAPA